MRNIIAVILALAVFGGLWYWFSTPHPSQPTQGQSPSAAQGTTAQTPAPSTATNYDECIAEGNKPLASDPTKCLTADGHLFIQGVVE